MRTINDLRDRWLDILPHAFTRPIMYTGRCESTELFFHGLLQELCWIDEREAEWERSDRELLWGCQRVTGQLQDQRLSLPSYINEITSSYANIASRLGYFVPSRLLTEQEWHSLEASLDDSFFARNWTENELHSAFGIPSHQVIGGDTTVACYASESRSRNWLFFDISRKRPDDEDNWFVDPVLRDVRIARNRFQLLPFGAWCKPQTAETEIETDIQ